MGLHLRLPHAGWYFFKISFDVTIGSQTESFGKDPVRIVGPSG